MPYDSLQAFDCIVESEHTRTTLRVFCAGDRLFSCEVTAIDEQTARITNASGSYNKNISLAVKQWLKSQKYLFVKYERNHDQKRTFKL